MRSKEKVDIFSQITNADVVRRMIGRVGWIALPYVILFVVILVLLNFFATIGAVSLVLLIHSKIKIK